MIDVINMVLPNECDVEKAVSFSIEQGDSLCLMGQSGAGKTSLLEILCGIRPWISGQLVVGGVQMECEPAERRQIGLVPQETVLFPTMSMEAQVEFPLLARGWSKRRRADRVRELQKLLQIEHLRGKYPKELSGGEAKRVALARALSFRPELLCLDEVTSGLDHQTAKIILMAIRQVVEEEGAAVLAVSHREEDARVLGSQVYQLGVKGLIAISR